MVALKKFQLRDIGAKIGEKSPQKIKHHLEQLVKMGAIDYVKGNYCWPRHHAEVSC